MSPSTTEITFTATATLGELFTTSIAAVPSATKAVVNNILDPSHPDPTAYNPADPIVLVIIQLAVIIGFSRFLALFLQRIRQPRVIAEVLGGIILGPTAFGRIPGFTEHIFPPVSLPFLNLLSTLGLILFLFLIGLEVDFALFRRNFKVSASVATAGMAIPFGMGCAVSLGLYKEFSPASVEYPHFLLFIGTSMSITAFPVLARILSELNLLTDRVGIIVLSSGVANDVVGWILLALTVGLVNASSGLIVLYIILCAVGWILCLFFIIRPIFAYAARKSGSFDGHGPTQTMVCFALMLCLASAWVTEEIGINAIFGGFCAGLIMPRQGGFPAKLTEKVEDILLTLFVPVYFALSGLKTNLGLLNSGIIWGWTICVIIVSFTGKFVGCATASRLNGFSTRESCAVGSLMSAKGLIELIVLNVGLTAGVITTTVFSIFVLEALLLTFLATPLTLLFYPSHLRVPYDSSAQLNGEEVAKALDNSNKNVGKLGRVTFVLERLEHLGAALIFTKLLAADSSSVSSSHFDTTVNTVNSDAGLLASSPQFVSPTTSSRIISEDAVRLDTIRLVELDDRTSTLMHASEWETTLRARDAISSLFSTFCSLEGITVEQASFNVVARSAFASTAARISKERGSSLIVLPWTLGAGEEEVQSSSGPSILPTPLESLFQRNTFQHSPTYATFIRDLFLSATTDVAIFLDRSTSSLQLKPTLSEGQTHLFLAFHGGADDRACLELLLRLVRSNSGVSATVVRVVKEAETTSDDESIGLGKNLGTKSSADTDGRDILQPNLTIPTQTIGGGGTRFADTVYNGREDELQATTQDEIALSSLDSSTSWRGPRLSFRTHHTSLPLASTLLLARQASTLPQYSQSRLILLAGRGRWSAASHRIELAELIAQKPGGDLGIVKSGEVRRCLGEVGTAYLVDSVGEGVLVVQSGNVKGVRGGPS